MNENLLHYALQYHARGLAVVPIRAGSKAPIPAGWQSKRLEESDLQHYFTNGHEPGGVGIITGQLSGNLVILDFDGNDWQAAFDHLLHAWPELEPAPVVETGSGKRHIWLRCPDLPPDFTVKQFKRGNAVVELRGNRCNNLAPPSRHPSGGRYRWLTDEADLPDIPFADLYGWLSEWAAGNQTQGERHKLPRRTLEFLAATDWPEGTRNKELYAAAQQFAAAGYSLDEAIQALEPVARRIGLDDREIEPTIKSAYTGAAGFEPAGRQTQGDDPAQPGTPTHDELARRWFDAAPLTAHGLGDWRRYQGGLWPVISGLAVKGEIKQVVQAAKREGIKPSAYLISSVTELAMLDCYITDEQWDNDPDRLVCANGVLHIPTRTLDAHRPDLYATTGVSYAYDPQAQAAHWTAFLFDLAASTSQRVVDFLQEFAGYALTTDTSFEIAVWLYGPPGSGKSTFLTGLQTMVGNRAGLLGLADVERNRFALAHLPGKTLMVSTEQPGDFIASTHILNAIISGEPITVDRKFKDAITITPRAKLCWAMNELPRVSDPNSGLFRRVKVVAFPVIPEADRDPQLKEQIKTEGAGILNWALEGLARLRARGGFDVPPEVMTATRNFQENNDIPARFVEDYCVTGTDANGEPYRTQGSKLYNAYRAWCLENGHKPQSSTSVAEDWRRLGFEKYLAAGRAYWRYVKLKAEFCPD